MSYICLGEQEGVKILVGGVEKFVDLFDYLKNGNFVVFMVLVNVDNCM